MGGNMSVVLVSNWWSVVLRGLLGIGIGIITFMSPVSTLTALVLLFGAYVFVDGVLAIMGAIRAARARDSWGVLLLEGVVGVATGFLAIVWPAITAAVLAIVIAAWAIITGVLEISAAIRLRKHIRGEWMLGMFGALSVIFGVLVAIAPLAGSIVMAMWVGAYAFVSGIVLTILGFRLRSRMHDVDVDEPRIAA
jgi:uncharacterized membrane protein HdeD (DUF308 family)